MISLGSAILAFTAVGVVFLCIVLFISWLVRPSAEGKETTYECGMEAEGDHRAIGFNYIQYAVLFLLFDLAALFLFLYAIATGLPAMVTVSFFLGLATLALVIIYGTREGRYIVT